MTIAERIASKELAIEKLNQKLARIKLALETGKNPYYYSESDIRYTMKDIEAAERQLQALRDKERLEQERAASRNVPAIDSFIEMWKAKVYARISKRIAEYYIDRDAVHAAYKKIGPWPYNEEAKAAYDLSNAQFQKDCRITHKDVQLYDRVVRTSEEGKYVSIMQFTSGHTQLEALDKLKDVLNKEGIRKYDYIIEKTNQIVGQITDASSLKTDARGEINGIIEGTRGTAAVTTIGAGGYNIQCFHLRVLVKEIKK